MDTSAIVRSAHDGTALELFERSGGYFLARLTGPNFQGTAKVYEYEPAHLTEFFAGLAANWKGWPGKREWSSLEGELAFGASIDSTGHISLSVQLHSGPYPFDWKLSAMILIEAGQLDCIANDVSAFVNNNSA